MIRGVNKVLLIGYLGREPEMRSTPNGRSVTIFTLGVTKTWNSTDRDKHNETEWFNIVAMGNLAEICRTLVKGQHVYIEGRLQSRKWVDNLGVHHSSFEVVCNEMIKLSDHRESSTRVFPPDNNEQKDTNQMEEEFPY